MLVLGTYIIMETNGFQGKRNTTIHLFSTFVFTPRNTSESRNFEKKSRPGIVFLEEPRNTSENSANSSHPNRYLSYPRAQKGSKNTSKVLSSGWLCLNHYTGVTHFPNTTTKSTIKEHNPHLCNHIC